MNKIIFITGATSGIGKAAAIKFAQNNCDLIITGRRNEKLLELQNQLTQKYNCKIFSLNFDVRDKVAVESAINSLTSEWKKIDVLVNNAGLSVGLEPVHEGQYDDWDRMIDTNIKGLLYVSRNILPLMVERKSGHVINIGSIAGKDTYANGNVYCATKHAVDSLTKAMRMELVKHNIKVTQISPGAAETEFSIIRFKGDKQRADKVYEGFTPLSAEDIADAIFYVTTLPPHVNVNDMLLMPTAQANATIFNRQI